MKALWISLLWKLVSHLVGNDSLLRDIKELVAEAANMTISGEEKKKRVLKELQDIGHNLAAIGGTLVNLAIEAAVIVLKQKAGIK
jgi:hypothetical protein